MGDLGQAEVGALAGVRGDQVVDGHGIVRSGHAAHLDQFLLAAVQRVDVEADAVEVAVHAGGEFAAADATGQFDRAGVQALYADLRQAPPQRFVGQGTEYRATLGRDDGVGVDGQPHRGDFGGAAGLGLGVRLLPQSRLA
ncbi:hypothetical protein D3C79_736670 [compost metagenome]